MVVTAIVPKLGPPRQSRNLLRPSFERAPEAARSWFTPNET
jgi:hypothetical protein